MKQLKEKNPFFTKVSSAFVFLSLSDIGCQYIEFWAAEALNNNSNNDDDSDDDFNDSDDKGDSFTYDDSEY